MGGPGGVAPATTPGEAVDDKVEVVILGATDDIVEWADEWYAAAVFVLVVFGDLTGAVPAAGCPGRRVGGLGEPLGFELDGQVVGVFWTGVVSWDSM